MHLVIMKCIYCNFLLKLIPVSKVGKRITSRVNKMLAFKAPRSMHVSTKIKAEEDKLVENFLNTMHHAHEIYEVKHQK